MKDNPYSAPVSEASAAEVAPHRSPIREASKRFGITYAWSLLVFAVFILLFGPPGKLLFGILGSAIISVCSGVIGMMIPVRWKLVYVPIGVFGGLAVSIVIGSTM